MSAIATVFAQREIPAGAPEIAPAATTVAAARLRRGFAQRRRPRTVTTGTLAALPVGARAVVTGLGPELDPAAARRLLDLGFAPGASVEVLRRAPMGDPTVFRVADTEIALRRPHAVGIRVEADLDVAHR